MDGHQVRRIPGDTPYIPALPYCQWTPVPTASGFATEHEETQHGAKVEVARRLWLCEVRDCRITEVVGYCNGGWTRNCGPATRSRPRCSDPDPQEASGHEGRMFASS